MVKRSLVQALVQALAVAGLFGLLYCIQLAAQGVQGATGNFQLIALSPPVSNFPALSAGLGFFNGDRIYWYDGETNNYVYPRIPRYYASSTPVEATSTSPVTIVTFGVAAGGTYPISLHFGLEVSSLSDYPEILVTCPGSPTYSSFAFHQQYNTTSNAVASGACGSAIAGVEGMAAVNTVYPGSEFSGLLINGSTAGNVTIAVESSGSYNTYIEPPIDLAVR